MFDSVQQFCWWSQRERKTVPPSHHRSLTLASSSPSRSREAIRGKGPGPLRSRHLTLTYHLHGLHHEDAAAAAGRGLRHHQAAPGSHLTQLQFHGSAAAVWVRGPLHGPGSRRHTWTGHTLRPGVRLLFCQWLRHHLQHQKLWAICVHPPYLLPAVPGPPPVQTEPNNCTALKWTVTACSLTWKIKINALCVPVVDTIRADRLEISNRNREEAYEINGLQASMLFSCLLNCRDDTTQHSDKLQYTCLRLILWFICLFTNTVRHLNLIYLKITVCLIFFFNNVDVDVCLINVFTTKIKLLLCNHCVRSGTWRVYNWKVKCD